MLLYHAWSSFKFHSGCILFRREFLGNKYNSSQGRTMGYTYFPILQGSFYCTIILFCLDSRSVSLRPLWSKPESSDHCSEFWLQINCLRTAPCGPDCPLLIQLHSGELAHLFKSRKSRLEQIITVLIFAVDPQQRWEEKAFGRDACLGMGPVEGCWRSQLFL